MSREEIVSEYMQWIQTVVYDKRYSNKPYSRLLEYLYETDFTWTIEMDANRAEEGIDLRYKFGDEAGIPDAIITDALDYRDCSVLEMMVALSRRCEVNIMGDPQGDNRTGVWFWNMIENLGLATMTDDKFDVVKTKRVITRLLDHRYEPNGEGGLFTVKHCDRDLRKAEIWYQMCWYLDEILYA